MLSSSFNFSTRCLSGLSFAMIALVLSITLLTELYLAILNSLPISARLSPLTCLIKYMATFLGSLAVPHLVTVKASSVTLQLLHTTCPYPSDIRCQGSRFRDLKVAYVKGKQPFLLMTSYHALGYLILNGLDIRSTTIFK